jgi:hypothetical protein
MRKMFFNGFVLLGLLLSYSPVSWAQLEVSPKIKWKTLNTDHFQVIFNAEQQDLGELYSERLEKAYRDLQPYFRSFPQKTVVVINDKTDVTNGYATPLPYSHIMAYPVLPGAEESLADTGDWVYELLSHEYTHILTFAPHGGVMQPLRAVFGTIIAPNLLLPRWWKEGVAVEMETRLSQHGRLRSVFQDATVRAMVLDETFLGYDIAEANEGLPSWPQGMRPYLFGSLFWSNAIKEKGPGVVADLHEKHGRRVPYFIETPARELLGADYTTTYNNMMAEVNVLAQTQVKKLQEVTPTRITLPRNRFNSVSGPAISPDGKHLVLITENDANSREIKVITREKPGQNFLEVKSIDTIEEFNEIPNTPLQRDGPPTGSIQRVSWYPDSKRFIYDKIDYSSRYERYSDLHIYDLETKKTKQVTKSLRAREPSVSPNGQLVTFVKLEGGKTHLATVSFDENKKEVRVLFTPGMQERISYPTFLDDGHVVFSWRKTNGEEFLYKIDLESKNPQMILPGYTNARFARLTAQGLIFASNKNGTSNLYLASTDLQTAKPLTHTVTANFTSDLDPQRQDLFVTTMTSQGLRVGAITQPDWSATPATLPQIQPLLADRYPTTAATAAATPAPSPEATPAAGTIEDYSAAGYLWPRYWIPFIGGSTSETGLVIMAQTSGFDPLKKHTYGLLGSWDTAIGRGSFEATYINQTTTLPITFFGFQRSSYLGSVENRIEDTGALLVGSPSMFWLSPYSSLQVGWKYLQRDYFSTSAKRTGPTVNLSYANYSKSGAEVTPESGWGGFLQADSYIEQQDYLQYSQFSVVGLKYMSKFLPRHHSLMIRVAGMYTPELISSIYGGSTESQVFASDSVLPQYIMRGYTRGQIYGRNIANANIEYRFPIYRIEEGSGTYALFFHNMVGALVADGITVDGRFINEDAGIYEAVSLGKQSFWSAGAEVKLETTLGYTFPFNLIVGTYAAFNQPTGVEYSLGTRFQFSLF